MGDLALLDLLECPLCFERLDISAKVLPCQHTFCKPCLQRMVYSKAEVRCPECRTPVSCGIEELPANLLLVRLLDGIWEGCQNGMRRSTSQRHIVSMAHSQSIRKGRDSRSSQIPQRRLTMSRRSPLDGVPCARALYNYRGNIPGGLNIKLGDLVILRQKLDENWYHGEANGTSGLFPASAVQVINQLPQALCPPRPSYDAETGSVKHTETAKANDSPETRSRFGDGRTSAVVGHMFSSTEPRSPRELLMTNALNQLNRLSQNPSVERQPHEFSSPTFGSSSNPALVTQLSRCLPEDSQVPSSPVEGTIVADSAPAFTMAFINPQSHATSAENNHSRQQISISVCAVLSSYNPRRPEELELHKGEMVGVYGKFKEGWLRGLSLRTGKVGILPGNYVTPVLRTSARFLDLKSVPAQAGKRSLTTKPPVAAIALDRITPNGTTRPDFQVHSVAMPTPVLSAGAARAAAQQEGTMGRGTVRRAFTAPQRGSSVKSNSSFQKSSTLVARPQQPHPSGITVQTHNIASAPVTALMRHNQPASTARMLYRVSETTSPTAGSSVLLDAIESVAKELPSKPATAARHSILIKPDSYKYNTEKPTKTVRFQTQDSPPPTRSSSQPPAGQTNLPTRPGVSAQDQRGNPVPAGYHSRGGSDSKIPLYRKGSSADISSPDAPLQGKRPATSVSQPNANRYRVVLPYAAQCDAELNLKDGESVLVQKTRQDGRFLVTQEKSGQTGLFQCNILDFLEKQLTNGQQGTCQN
nr:PREDICTED: putative E3 ubiquitin-protein ligase SH3RF2 isoform X1 [Lepisosteus oculatus]XP_015204954.1 PREDICTED: putative E3 ubiquitin-protein ligase SH3RF2 isoform X1 [Lepisosteus oculatus]XP_015204955.1 PREDICTED: putative E3 ubiquitin-protein ligase SH3RF2 isoform X1 [Lepisosteus oculatus]XP_015204956.1 PREDICTED: putative E3 ubiquitin-protein ligase SH3RF2 isoform X1 [Lepisosteus oculatus]XP_015204957.1 PREDICTED: putative E3 ubiquitin-protein ligase SH3RF2 isoform X1 [Lepisosteus ocula